MIKVGVVDLFCGIGGLSYGLNKAGLQVLAGYDLDESCSFAFERNNHAPFIHKDIRDVSGKEVSRILDGSDVKVLAGCAPCQPFSSYAFKNEKKDPDKYDLLYEFGRLVKEVHPDIVTMENVVQIINFKKKPVLKDFQQMLKQEGYFLKLNKVFCPDYGIPQRRRRLVLLASRFGQIDLIPRTHMPESYVTVKDTIGDLPSLNAGECDPCDPLHRARALSPINLERVKLTPYGGGWKDWPDSFMLECHKKESGKSFGSVYGRMVWEKPAPTITTQCTGLGNGRFGHPVQDRAISLREAALLQSFPITYQFFKNEREIAITKVSRYIGNAVPPKLGEVIAKSIMRHILMTHSSL